MSTADPVLPSTGEPAGIKQKLHDLGSHVKDAAGEKLHHVKEATSETLHHARDAAADYVDAGREKAQQAGHQVEVQIRRHPAPALLVAAGLGFLLGACWMRR